MDFLRTARILDMHIVIQWIQNLSFGRPGASTMAPLQQFWNLGDTLQNHIFMDLGMILGS